MASLLKKLNRNNKRTERDTLRVLPLAEFVGYRAENLQLIFGSLRNRLKGYPFRPFLHCYDKADALALDVVNADLELVLVDDRLSYRETKSVAAGCSVSGGIAAVEAQACRSRFSAIRGPFRRRLNISARCR